MAPRTMQTARKAVSQSRHIRPHFASRQNENTWRRELMIAHENKRMKLKQRTRKKILQEEEAKRKDKLLCESLEKDRLFYLKEEEKRQKEGKEKGKEKVTKINHNNIGKKPSENVEKRKGNHFHWTKERKNKFKEMTKGKEKLDGLTYNRIKKEFKKRGWGNVTVSDCFEEMERERSSEPEND